MWKMGKREERIVLMMMMTMMGERGRERRRGSGRVKKWDIVIE